MRRLSPEAVALRSAGHPWFTVAAWIVAVVVAVGLSSNILGDVLTTDARLTNNPESERAATLIEEHLGVKEGFTEVLIVSSPDLTVDDPAFEAHVRSVATAAREVAEPSPRGVVTFYDVGDPGMVSDDRHTTLVPVTFAYAERNDQYLPHIEALVEQAGTGSFEAHTFGRISMEHELSGISEEDLRKGESIGVLVALIVLLSVFGTVVASLLPIALALASIGAALGLVALVGLAFELSFFITNILTMMGLAVGVDYSLFIVSRYREERGRGLDKHAAIGVAGATAGRAVVFSGITVMLALAGMLLLPNTIFRSLGTGAMLVVFATIVASLTLLPALLSLLGDRIDALRVGRRNRGEAAEGRFWDRVARRVMRRPVVSLVLGAGVMLLAAVPVLGMETGFSGVDALPGDTKARQAFDILSTEFSGGQSDPVEIVVEGDARAPEVRAAIGRLTEALAADPGFGPAAVQPLPSGQATLVAVPVTGNPSGEAAMQAVDRARDEYVPAAFDGVEVEALVGGDPALFRDVVNVTNGYTPWVFAFVLGLSFLLLLVVFRSVVVPLKAILLNLLSVGAAYGLIVLVSQHGVGADLLGFRDVDAIEAWLPLFLFSVLFGLSMDYHVFLLSRIREHFDETGDNTESVAYGLRTTGRLITGAALIMVAVFSGFAAGRLTDLQQTGFGLAVAVLLDATLVRSVLVPSTMQLLGERNWYLPTWLRWLPKIGIEAPPRPEAAAEVVDLREPDYAFPLAGGR